MAKMKKKQKSDNLIKNQSDHISPSKKDNSPDTNVVGSQDAKEAIVNNSESQIKEFPGQDNQFKILPKFTRDDCAGMLQKLHTDLFEIGKLGQENAEQSTALFKYMVQFTRELQGMG